MEEKGHSDEFLNSKIRNHLLNRSKHENSNYRSVSLRFSSFIVCVNHFSPLPLSISLQRFSRSFFFFSSISNKTKLINYEDKSFKKEISLHLSSIHCIFSLWFLIIYMILLLSEDVRRYFTIEKKTKKEYIDSNHESYPFFFIISI